MSDKPAKSRKQQALETKIRIYQAAVALMEKNNYQSITIEDISKKAGVSVGAFYHYFKSKNDIFFEIYLEADRYFEEYVASALTAPSGCSRVLEYFSHYARYCLNVGFDTVKSLYNTDNKLFVKYERFMLSLLQQIIIEAQNHQLMTTEQSAAQIAECLLIAARGVIFDWCLHDGQYDLESAMQQYIKRLLSTFVIKNGIN
ncbi:TetR/AcrR family transcriptional regulator [Tolumonas lignilytica]|uniref:TetR/AcrR family transcriptional regulator n=1 Tax=Tolumonas lignilytica TaxID=1283284 RepID=UPI0004637A55|nr:TetR/AcrR family transcriptional regulator [Tolumonas lignilytica]